MKRSGLVILLLLSACATQKDSTIPRNQYGLEIIDSAELYQRTVAGDPEKELVELFRVIPGIRLDVRYATEDNFLGKVLYPEARVFLRRPAAEALARVAEELASEGLGLKLFDGYRPYHVTVMMWEAIRNPDYVADPARGSRHNRGAAVDLTLIRLDSGEELAMPTAYDSFEETAHHEFTDLPPEVIRNREKLRQVMERHGFEALPSEWWHYDFTGWQRFELMDIAFGEI